MRIELEVVYDTIASLQKEKKELAECAQKLKEMLTIYQAKDKPID